MKRPDQGPYDNVLWALANHYEKNDYKLPSTECGDLDIIVADLEREDRITIHRPERIDNSAQGLIDGQSHGIESF